MTSITTRITTPFGFHSTAAEVLTDVDLSGKRAIVTGAASGIGVETARALAGAGADVTLAVRNPHAGADIAAEITANTGNRAVYSAALELTNPQSIYRFIGSWRGPLHILVNNAGVMASPEAHTDDGWEMQFATNHLGHFALTLGLQPALAAAGGARIVAVSSSGHLWSPVVFDDVNFRFRPYEPLLAYGQSKTAVVLFAVEATARWSEDGIYANALNPGAIQTNLQRHVGGTVRTPAESQKNPAAGRGDIRPLGGVTAPGGHRWTLLRRLQRGDSRRPPARRVHRTGHRRCSLRARPRQRDAAVGALNGSGVVMRRSKVGSNLVAVDAEGAAMRTLTELVEAAVRTGLARNRYISVLTIADRKVTRWRDYLDPVAVFDAVAWPSH